MQSFCSIVIFDCSLCIYLLFPLPEARRDCQRASRNLVMHIHIEMSIYRLPCPLIIVWVHLSAFPSADPLTWQARGAVRHGFVLSVRIRAVAWAAVGRHGKLAQAAGHASKTQGGGVKGQGAAVCSVNWIWVAPSSHSGVRIFSTGGSYHFAFYIKHVAKPGQPVLLFILSQSL